MVTALVQHKICITTANNTHLIITGTINKLTNIGHLTALNKMLSLIGKL